MVTQNDDVKVWIELYAEDIATPYDNPLPHASLDDYHVYAYTKCRDTKRLVAVYKKNNTGLYAIGTDASNEITVVLNRELLRTLNPNDFSLEVKVKIVATTDFIDARANTSVNDIFLFPLLSSASPRSMQ